MRLASVAHLPDAQSDRWRWARILTVFGIFPLFLGASFLVVGAYWRALAFWIAGLAILVLVMFGIGAAQVSALGGPPHAGIVLIPLAIVASVFAPVYAAFELDRLRKGARQPRDAP